MLPRIFSLLAVLGGVAILNADPPMAKSPRQALQAFSEFIGAWKCTGTPAGSLAEKQKNFWTEKASWEWQFKGNDAWLKIVFDKGKYFSTGELHYNADKDNYRFTLVTPQKETLTYTGDLVVRETTKILTLDRAGDKETHRLVFRLLHDNVFNYSYAVKPEGRPLFTNKWSVLAVKEGQAFAGGDGKPECVVSGGAGTTAVSYMGKTYYVCCSGCRAEFNENPAKYVKEFEAKRAKKK